MVNRKSKLKKTIASMLCISMLCSMLTLGYAADDASISKIDFEKAGKTGANITGTDSVGGSQFTIMPLNAAVEGAQATAEVVALSEYANNYPGINDSRMGSKALMFKRTENPIVMLRWNQVYDLSKTVVGEMYEASVWVYCADVEQVSAKQKGTSALNFYVSKSGSTVTAETKGSNDKIADNAWTKLSFSFEMTEEIKSGQVNCFRMDSPQKSEGKNWAKTIFADNFTLKKAVEADAAFMAGKNALNADYADYSEIAGQSYEEAVCVLSALGIMQGDNSGEFAPERQLTRAEILTIIMRLYGINDNLSAGEDVFDDVPSIHWASGAINAAYSLGIIHGDGNGKFYPDNPCNAAEAIKMVVCALGYEPMALSYGTYPEGYIKAANNLKLLKDAGVSYTAPILRWQCAQMVFNALEVELMEKDFGTDDTHYIDDSRNFLNDIFDAERKRGTLTSVKEIELNDDTDDYRSEVTFDGVTYETQLNLKSMLGKECYYYVRYSETNDYEVIACFDLKGANKILEVMFEDLISVNATSTDKISVEYYENNRKKSASFENTNYLYNEDVIPYSSASQLQSFLDSHMQQGRIRFVSNGESCTVFVENYKAYVVERVVEYSEKIYYICYGKTSNTSGAIDLSDKEYKVYDTDGAEMELGKLIPGDVISVYANADDTSYVIYESNATVTGEIESLELISGSEPVDYQPPQTVVKYVKIADKNFSDWAVKSFNPFNLIGSEKNNGSNEEFIALPRGMGSNPPSGVTSPVFVGAKISYADMAVATDNANTADDAVYDDVIYDDDGNIREGNATKVTTNAAIGMARFNNILTKMTPGTAEEPVRLKIQFEVYLTDVYEKSGVPDSDNSIATLPVNVYLRAGTTDNMKKTVNVPVNQWTSVECEYSLTGNVSDIHGLMLEYPGLNLSSSSAYNSTPFAGTLYFGGDLEVWMDDEVLEYPEEVPDTCKYEVKIGKKTYRVADTFKDSLLVWSPLGLRANVTLLLDNYEKIVGYKSVEASTGEYGMIMGASAGSGFKKAQVKILTTNGELKVFECDKKIKGYNGRTIVKEPLSYFITSEPSDPKTDWHIWSTNNESNFRNVNRTWLSAENKSDAASRKIVYYKTNTEGLITEILVPSMPTAMQDSKLSMLKDFRTTPSTNIFSDVLIYRHNFGRLVRNNYGAKPDDELGSYEVSKNVIVYEVLANEYTEEDYSVAKDFKSVREGSHAVQVYSFSDEQTADIIVVNRPTMNSQTTTNVMIDKLFIKSDGGCTLKGFKGGEAFSCEIPEDLRVLERLWYTDEAHTEKITADNIAAAQSRAVVPVCFSYEGLGQNTPLVHEAGLKKGDIVRIALDSNGVANYVEVASRADEGISNVKDDYINNTLTGYMDSTAYNKVGTVTDIDYDSKYLEMKTYMWYAGSGVVSSSLKEKRGNDGIITDANLWYNIGSAKVAICDREHGNDITVGSLSDIEEGDRIFIAGRGLGPTTIYVWK